MGQQEGVVEGRRRRGRLPVEWGWLPAPPPKSVPAAWPPPGSWARLGWHSPPHPHSTSYPAEKKSQGRISIGGLQDQVLSPRSEFCNLQVTPQ